MTDVRFAKLVVFVNALVPLVLLLWDLYQQTSWSKSASSLPPERPEC